MKSKDTVLSLYQQAEAWLKAEQSLGCLMDCSAKEVTDSYYYFMNNTARKHWEEIEEAQAEVSFLAGQRELLKWANEGCYDHYPFVTRGGCSYCKKAKQKELDVI